MIKVKRGTTFILRVKLSDDDIPITGEASNIKSQIRDSQDSLIASFVITETETLGEYEFRIESEVTSTFPLGNLMFDIKYEVNGAVVQTETVSLLVLGGVTHD